MREVVVPMSSSGLTTILASSSSTPTDHRSSSNHHHRLLLASNPASAGSLAHTQSSSFLSNNSSNNTSNHNIISSLVPSVNVTCRSSLLNSHTAGAASFLSSADSNNSITTASTILNDSEFPSLGVRSSPSSTSAFTSIPTTSYSSQSPISSSNSSGSGAGGGNGGGQHTSIGLGVGANNILNNINGLTSNSGTSNSITTSLSATTTQPNITNNIINNNLYSSTSNNSNNSSTGASSVAKDVYTALQRPYANLMRTNDGNSLSANNVEFHIQNEDFPALPGANHLDATHGQIPLGNNTDGVLSDSRYTERSTTTISENTKTGIQTFPDGTVKNIPAGMLSDQFGMAGLLTFLRAIESDPAIVALALGHDLTTLGLNLNAPERNLYATFGGPWADFPCRTQDLDAKVPEEYLTNVAIREKLPNIKLNKLSEDVLFYLFYNCPGEVYQMAAACELYSRDWRFHKGLCVWLTRSQYGGVKEQTSTYEKGSYNVFDPVQWRKIPKDMTLEYKELEERPKLPQSLQQQQQQTSGQQAAQTGATNVVSQNGS